MPKRDAKKLAGRKLKIPIMTMRELHQRCEEIEDGKLSPKVEFLIQPSLFGTYKDAIETRISEMVIRLGQQDRTSIGVSASSSGRNRKDPDSSS